MISYQYAFEIYLPWLACVLVESRYPWLKDVHELLLFQGDKWFCKPSHLVETILIKKRWCIIYTSKRCSTRHQKLNNNIPMSLQALKASNREITTSWMRLQSTFPSVTLNGKYYYFPNCQFLQSRTHTHTHTHTHNCMDIYGNTFSYVQSYVSCWP